MNIEPLGHGPRCTQPDGCMCEAPECSGCHDDAATSEYRGEVYCDSCARRAAMNAGDIEPSCGDTCCDRPQELGEPLPAIDIAELSDGFDRLLDRKKAS